MKLKLSLTIDDEPVCESIANLTNGDKQPEAITIKWMLLGMLQDASQGIKVVQKPDAAMQPPPDGVL